MRLHWVSRVQGGVLKKGWFERVSGRGFMILRAEPYDDTPPWVPFIIDRWSISVEVMGWRLFSWNREARRHVAKTWLLATPGGQRQLRPFVR